MEQQTITVEKLFETIGRQAMMIAALQAEVARFTVPAPDEVPATNGREPTRVVTKTGG